MAFEKWQFTAAEMTRQQFMMQGVLDRVHRQALSSTLGVINEIIFLLAFFYDYIFDIRCYAIYYK